MLCLIGFFFEHHKETKQMAKLGTGCFSWVVLQFKITVNFRVSCDDPIFFLEYKDKLSLEIIA